ncbi:hypothetical protein OROMI_009427 [Orobanche minor]
MFVVHLVAGGVACFLLYRRLPVFFLSRSTSSVINRLSNLVKFRIYNLRTRYRDLKVA